MTDRPDISALNDLIETCRDGEMGFWNAAEHVQDAGLKWMFQSIARKRGQYAEELKQEVRRLGGAVDEGGSIAGSIHRRWMDVKSLVGRHDEAAMLAEAERGDRLALGAYESALRQSLPAPTQAIVQRQYAEVRQAWERVSGLEEEWKRRG